ncbi:hypothetical protein LZ30DRAFT_590832 [Colletotrichum cereale]|nr:hypothetical protein LZ30DRAFT_590832 [Colletotrichum cereale]
MSGRDQQPLQHSMSSTFSPQAPPIQTTYAPREAHDLLRKLQEATVCVETSQAFGNTTNTAVFE